ncbi:hypothetical protein RKE38_07235 [Phycicoccus sp. M110.8]|uniref:hypothetical protein n=1 Tax=Phycicoccus sp. M110.8 TaxID=3075433 RepID=UPI0028FD7955|nr:hypothetical protein [Phycicoccus sp. M110.8]MDU0313475.1 hypothetical protein [Phycicoccus sp. M110.8]
MGMDDTMERVPERFLRQYEEQLAAPSFSVDDLVAGGRRRVRRRRAAVVTGVATLVVAVGGLLAGAAVSQGGGRQGLAPAGTGGTSSSATTPSPRGCVTQPETCVTVVAAWSREVAHSTATVRTEAADAYEPGTVVIEQTVSSVLGIQDVHLSVVIAPTTTEPKAGSGVPHGPEPVSLPGVPGQAGRLTSNGGGNLVDSYRLPSTASRPAVEVVLNAANQGPVGGSYSETSDDVRAPAWWTEANVADLLTRLYGSQAVRQAGPGAEVVASPGCSRSHERCSDRTWETWASSQLDTGVAVQAWDSLSSGIGQNDVQGWYQSVQPQPSRGELVTLSIGKDVARYGGLSGDDRADSGSVRRVALPWGGEGEVQEWLDRTTRRQLWLVPATASSGEMRLVVSSPSVSVNDAKGRPQPLLPRWTDEAALTLLSAVR